ncbi:MAG TPA: trypsin-like peptidase domain-containing protein [Solirubrobacterales bacterium]|nr:trypsin-like peptidase domain-containing protein [Solirubrobacterales bacterium]
MSGRPRSRRAATAALLLLAAALALALLAGCGSGTSTVIFKDKTEETQSGSTAESEEPREGAESAEAGEPLPEVAIEAASPGFDAARIYEGAAPGVVTIRAVYGGAGGAEGSGFVLADNGEIVTNAHVVTDESSGTRKPASEVFVEFENRNVLEAKIVGFDPFADVALLKVEPEGFPLHPLQLGDDKALVVGEPVAAIGSPFGEQRSLSVGVVSATDRSVKSLTQFQIEGAIQTDASINPGNSGGPLLEANAKVVGINQQIETNSGANDGVGFAVPISLIEHSVEQLRENGHAEYAYIGVSTQPLYPQLARKLGLDTEFGALIANVVPGGPAAKAGLRGATGEIQFQAAEYETGGDVIVDVEGQPVTEPDSLIKLIDEKVPGEKIKLTILRDNKRQDIEVTLGKRPDQIEPE